MDIQTDKIIEGNKLIAEFMGAKYEYDPQYNSYAYRYEMDSRPTETSSRWWSADQMQYNSSWDWLQPVWDKIELIPYITCTYERFGKDAYPRYRLRGTFAGGDSFDFINDAKDGNKIMACWLTIVQFIDWNNKHDEKMDRIRKSESNYGYSQFE